MDFLLVFVELLSLCVTDEAIYEKKSIENRRNVIQRGQFGPKFQVEGVVPSNYSSCQ